MTRRLTAKQELFVQGLVAGASQREAYRGAYSCTSSSDKTVDNKAYALFKRDGIRARYDELMAELAARVLWDREKATRELLEVRDIALAHIRQTKGHTENFTEKDSRELADLPKTAVQLVIASTAELNKMFGVYDRPDGEGGRVVIVDDV